MGTLRITPMDKSSAEQIPILRRGGATKALATTPATARTTVPAGGDVLRLLADEAMMVELGGASVDAAVATSFPLAANIPEYVLLDGNTHIAAIDVA